MLVCWLARELIHWKEKVRSKGLYENVENVFFVLSKGHGAFLKTLWWNRHKVFLSVQLRGIKITHTVVRPLSLVQLPAVCKAETLSPLTPAARPYFPPAPGTPVLLVLSLWTWLLLGI